MMTLQLKKCVSLFVCLSLLLSACSPDKSSKASSKGNNVNSGRSLTVAGAAIKEPDSSADGPRWYKPTWYTVTTELGVGIGGGETRRRYFEKKVSTKSALVLSGTTIGAALVAGEAARAVTTGFELGAGAGAGAGALTGAVAGAMTGATIFATIVCIISGNFNKLFPAIILGVKTGAFTGGIAGLLTGLETGYFAKRPKKLDNQKQNVNETTNNATTKDTPKLKQEEQKHKPAKPAVRKYDGLL